MEIKLKTTPADENERTIRDEHGALWKYSASESVYGIFPATTKGLDGKDIHAFYKNGALFIVNWSDARHYFNSMNRSPGEQSAVRGRSPSNETRDLQRTQRKDDSLCSAM